jgi:hypothetical protein
VRTIGRPRRTKEQWDMMRFHCRIPAMWRRNEVTFLLFASTTSGPPTRYRQADKSRRSRVGRHCFNIRTYPHLRVQKWRGAAARLQFDLLQ